MILWSVRLSAVRLRRWHRPRLQLLTEIFTSQMGVSSCCLDFKNTIVDCQERHIEGSSSKIVDNDLALVPSAVKTICDSGGGWLIHDSKDVQAGNGAGILRSLSLVVVEVGWNSDDSVDHLLSKVTLCDFLHLSEYHGRNFFRGERPVFSLDLDGDGRLVILVLHAEREVLNVRLYVFVVEFASNQSSVRLVSDLLC